MVRTTQLPSMHVSNKDKDKIASHIRHGNK